MRPRSFVINIGLAVAYALVYMQCYVSFLHFNFAYAGAELYQRDALFVVASVALATLPILCYRGVLAISSIISLLVYLVLYVPIILTFALGSSKPPGDILVVQLTFMCGMALLFMADAIIIKSPFDFDIGVDLMPVVLVLTIASTVYTFVVYRGSLHFPGFGEVLYDQRFANASLGAGLVTRYLLSWLSTVLIPLCLGYGLTTKSFRYAAAGTAACVILYMGAANKITILLPGVFLAFYLLAKNRLQVFYPLLSGGLTLAVVGLMTVAAVPGSLLYVAAAIFLNRTIGNGGQLAVAYYDFFTFFPQTEYSHIHGISLLTRPYPYGDLIPGQVVGQYFFGPTTTANASFWATDGIAAFGLTGVAIASAAFAMVLVVMNSITRTYDTLFVSLCFLPFVVTLLNQSMFSSLWSGGGIFLLVFFLLNAKSSTQQRQRP